MMMGCKTTIQHWCSRNMQTLLASSWWSCISLQLCLAVTLHSKLATETACQAVSLKDLVDKQCSKWSATQIWAPTLQGSGWGL